MTPTECGVEGAASSSLVYNRISLGDQTCPRKRGFIVVSESTGAIAPASCGVNSCPVCGRRKAMATACAVDGIGPERMFSLTGISEPKAVKPAMSRVRWQLRDLGYSWQDWSIVEVNPRDTGYHVHGWQWGDFVPQATLARVARSEGFGVVTDIRKWHRAGLGGNLSGVAYAVKAATAYGIKAALVEDRDDSLDRFLEVNGGRMGMWSQGFFRGPYGAAVKAAMSRIDREGHDPGPWRLMGTAGRSSA